MRRSVASAALTGFLIRSCRACGARPAAEIEALPGAFTIEGSRSFEP